MPDASERLLPGKVSAERRRFFRRREKAPLKPAAASSRRSDLTVAALGVTLGLICALFPWYIFFNQEKFLPKGIAFNAVPGLGNGRATLTPTRIRLGGHPDKPAPEIPIDQLDLLATGTTPDRPEEKKPDPAEQPFPVPVPRFRVVHIENGRAMVEDDGGLFVVGRGDLLPDGSRVARIEENGQGALVTSEDKVLKVAH